MTKHCFVDESGTMADQHVMTVAVVVLDGARTAEKIHPKLTRAVFAPPKVRGLKELERWYAAQELHFTEMNESQKLAVGSVLGAANISVVIGYCKHSIVDVAHDVRFELYRELLKCTIRKAFLLDNEFVVSIAKQGGWESYGPSLISELRTLPEQFTTGGNYRKANFLLASPSKQGHQIADFYASSSRNFLIADGNNAMSAPFDRVSHQVVHFEELAFKKGRV